MKCKLCSSKTKLFYIENKKSYFQCENCESICLDTQHFPSNKEELERYLEHNNNIEDKGYQNFVQPIVSSVLKNFTKKHIGLDYGCGPGPVISKLLKDKNYNITPFDPFFENKPEVLKRQYNYIICCEVIEHFHNPLQEFQRLKSLLKPNGKLFCMTDVFSKKIDFKNWYYKNDITHVIFYHKNTFNWIQKNIGFTQVTIENRLITLEI